MKKLALCAATALALAACGESAPATNEAQAIRIANPGSDRLKQATPLNQRIALMRAIRDSGKRCRRVDALGYQQDYRQLAMWVALCDDGRHWAVFIAPNEDLQVRDCREHAQLDLPVCRPVPPVPPDPDFPQAKTLPPGNSL
jgi:hypothetical protein